MSRSTSTTSLPRVGDLAPPFRLPASSGTTIGLSDYVGKQAVVLYFYPRADTPGCTAQACGFRDALVDFERANVAVLGVSPDTPGAVARFARKFRLTFPLLADADHAVADVYGVWGEKVLFGRRYLGVRRTTFVIGTDGTVRHVFEKVKPEGHDAEVLAWLGGGRRED